MNATKLLEQDHKAVKNLFAKYEKAGDRAYKTKRDLFEQIKEELTIHAQIEEEIFYPAIRAVDSEGQDLVEEALEEHEGMKSMLEELADMDIEGEEYDAKMQDLREEVEHHVEEEESEVFEFAEEHLSERLDELGEELRERKESLKSERPKGPRPSPRRGASR